MLASKIVDIGLGKIFENCTRNLYIVKRFPCGVRGQTVTSERYVTMLQKFFIPYENEWVIPNIWFQQDGATTHTARISMNVILETFGGPDA